MAVKQRYGIKYPFENLNLDEVFLDTNDTYVQAVTSQLFHVLFTPKGQRLRDPNFGTDLIKFIYDPADETTFGDLKLTIRQSVATYVPNVEFNDIDIIDSERGDDHEKIIKVTYTVTVGNNKVQTTAATII